MAKNSKDLVVKYNKKERQIIQRSNYISVFYATTVILSFEAVLLIIGSESVDSNIRIIGLLSFIATIVLSVTGLRLKTNDEAIEEELPKLKRFFITGFCRATLEVLSTFIVLSSPKMTDDFLKSLSIESIFSFALIILLAINAESVRQIYHKFKKALDKQAIAD